MSDSKRSSRLRRMQTAASAVIPPFSTIGWTQIFVPNVVHKSLQTVGRSDKLGGFFLRATKVRDQGRKTLLFLYHQLPILNPQIGDEARQLQAVFLFVHLFLQL